MEIKKQAKFRVTMMDIKSGKTKVITIYTDKNLTLEEFKKKLVEKIKEIE